MSKRTLRELTIQELGIVSGGTDLPDPPMPPPPPLPEDCKPHRPPPPPRPEPVEF